MEGLVVSDQDQLMIGLNQEVGQAYSLLRTKSFQAVSFGRFYFGLEDILFYPFSREQAVAGKVHEFDVFIL